MKNIMLMAASFMLAAFFSNCSAQKISNAKTETVQVFGNCGMCKKTIEKAANVKGVAKADWDTDTKMAVLTFDSTQTNADDILKRIAAAGYDSPKYRADDAAYANLHSCCQYDRPAKMTDAPAPVFQDVVPAATPAPAENSSAAAANTNGMIKKKAATPVQTPDAPAEKPTPDAFYSAYFALKDALVASDATLAATQAKALATAMTPVKAEALEASQRNVWQLNQPKIAASAEKISASTDLEAQRSQFVGLSDAMFAVMKSIRPTQQEVYFDHCPMANDGNGANWISLERPIKNPYYGQSMLTCGKVVETLK